MTENIHVSRQDAEIAGSCQGCDRPDKFYAVFVILLDTWAVRLCSGCLEEVNRQARKCK